MASSFRGMTPTSTCSATGFTTGPACSRAFAPMRRIAEPRSSRIASTSRGSLVTQAKASGNYLNSILAKIETTREGYEEAIMLDHTGMVSEASGENIFIVRDGVLATPPPGTILDGVTRQSIMKIAGDL